MGKLTFAEQQQYHAKAGIEADLNQSRLVINQILRLNDQAVDGVKSHLIGAGYWPADGLVESVTIRGEAITKSSQRAIAKVRGQAQPPRSLLGKKAQAKAKEKLALTECPHFVPEDPVPSKFWTIGALSARLLTIRLVLLGTTVLSKANINAWAQWGFYDEARLEMVNIIEFLTGQVDAAFRLAGVYRCFKYVDRTIRECYDTPWPSTKSVPASKVE